jgi:hypothetical protein
MQADSMCRKSFLAGGLGLILPALSFAEEANTAAPVRRAMINFLNHPDGKIA